MSHKILVIDDERVTQRLVTHALKTLSVETITASDGAEAMDVASNHNFFLAIVDINLPDIDGFELIKHLKQIETMQDVPMIAFTARNNPDDNLLAEEAGAIGFLYKPFSTQALRDLVKEYLPK